MSRKIVNLNPPPKIKDDQGEQEDDKKNFEEVLLNAPILTEEEIKNIENVGKEFRNWKIEKF